MSQEEIKKGTTIEQEDALLLDCLEDLLRVLDASLKQVKKVKSIHTNRIEEWVSEIQDHRRILEEISAPARLIIEHILECKYKGAQVAIEAGQLTMSCTAVRRVNLEEFGLIKITLGGLELIWRDEDYNYYFYPDKIELRAKDEKSAIKLFFTLSFSRQHVEKFSGIIKSPNVVYVHPQMLQWLKKGSEFDV